jgi:biopolymer transport protein ExbD
MTSLIDVIFLLLLFFMLTSTFSKFSEVELTAASAGATTASTEPLLFLRLAEDSLSLNGQALTLNALGEALPKGTQDSAPRALLVSLTADVTAQRLTDLLVILRDQTGVSISVLGRS